jgi:hypothetical protein
MLTLLRTSPHRGAAAKEETTMAMVHEPRHRRGACTPQGNALCLGVAFAGLVIVAMILTWLFGLVGLLL